MPVESSSPSPPPQGHRDSTDFQALFKDQGWGAEWGCGRGQGAGELPGPAYPYLQVTWGQFSKPLPHSSGNRISVCGGGAALHNRLKTPAPGPLFRAGCHLPGGPGTVWDPQPGAVFQDLLTVLVVSKTGSPSTLAPYWGLGRLGLGEGPLDRAGRGSTRLHGTAFSLPSTCLQARVWLGG